MSELTFAEMQPPKYTVEEVAALHATIRDDYTTAHDAEGRQGAVQQWDALRRALGTWRALVGVRFRQQTSDADRKADHKAFLDLLPKFDELDDAMKRFLLESDNRAELEQVYGAQPFALWALDVTVRSPDTEAEERRESELVTEYTELTGAVMVDFDGEPRTPSQMQPFLTSADRSVRRDAQHALWTQYDAVGPKLDTLFDELVDVRTSIGRKLGQKSFTDIGYRRMQRTDYNAADVQTFRGEVLTQVLPLARALRARQAEELGLAPDELMYWDEPVHSTEGNAQLIGEGVDWLADTAGEMFQRMGPRFDAWWQMMRDRELLDLPARSGKAAGAFVTDLSHFDVPFMFCNSAGVKSDVKTLAHESGHAFQVYQSRHHKLIDSWWPTSEGAEIHSMSLEFLTWPHMELFFGKDAKGYQKQHLTESLLFLPYGVAVDHFQHMIYQTPDLSPNGRKLVWKGLEDTYLPWRNYGDMPLAGSGGLWQRQIHVYCYPFYYIDYTLALTCALQIWLKSVEDYDAALEMYIALCERGGSLPFTELVASAGLVSPFEQGCLANVVAQAREVLEL